MDTSASTPTSLHSSGGRRHLKRLSLSVGSSSVFGGSGSPTATMSAERSQRQLSHEMGGSSPMTPDRHASTASPSSGSSLRSHRDSALNRSVGAGAGSSSFSSSGRRQRPMSLYGGSSGLSPITAGVVMQSDAEPSGTQASPSPLARTSLLSSLSEEHHNASSSAEREDADASFSPTVTLNCVGNLSNSVGRRSILGRSAGARRQSSISYARSNGSDSAPSTPRSSATLSREGGFDASIGGMKSPMHGEAMLSPAASSSSHSANAPRTAQAGGYFPAQAPSATVEENGPASEAMAPTSSTSSINEMNIGIGARSADLLTFIAKKERKCMDLREELKRHEEELATLKKKWEAVIQREMQAAQAPVPSPRPAEPSNVSPTAALTSPTGAPALPSAGGLFSSLASSLTASTSTSSSSTLSTLSASPSPKPTGNRRLLTARHSVSVSSPSRSSSTSPVGAKGFLGGADLSQQVSPTPSASSASSGSTANGEAYDVSKMAKSWLGGMMKSATSVLDSLAPPPSSPSPNDLGTVREEEEPEEGDEEDSHHRSASRTLAGHPGASDSQQHGRKISEATTNGSSSSAGSGSPSSTYEGDRFSSSTSRSSVSSFPGDDEAGDSRYKRHDGDDITPVATPVLESASQATPRGGSGDNSGGADAEDLWGLSGFENDSAREAREKLERDRIDVAHASSPPRVLETAAASPSLGSSAGSRASHGRRRSTAFELGGAWGSMVGKKWTEVTNSEVLKNSKRATMNFVDTFEKTLTDVMTVDPSKEDGGSGNNSSMTLVNGEYVPSLDWPVPPQDRAPSPSQKQRELPSGIGGAASWSALLGGSKSAQPKHALHNGNVGESATASHSPGSISGFVNGRRSSSGRRASANLLDDNDDEMISEQSFSTSPAGRVLQPRGTAQSSSGDPVQNRLQASRAKHQKRMSMPSNLLTGQPRKSSLGGSPSGRAGLGLDSLNEEEDAEKAEAEDNWGW